VETYQLGGLGFTHRVTSTLSISSYAAIVFNLKSALRTLLKTALAGFVVRGSNDEAVLMDDLEPDRAGQCYVRDFEFLA
jgi:hypothetical protein